MSKAISKPSTAVEIKKESNAKEHNENQQLSETISVSDVEPLVSEHSSVAKAQASCDTSPLLTINRD